MNSMLTALAAHKGFVVYRLAPLPGGKKTDKIPIDGVTGYNSDAQNMATWLTPAMAEAFALEWAGTYTHGTGVGLVVYEGSQIFCIDLDGCVNPDGTLTQIAVDTIAKFPGCPVEYSQSHTGLHIFGTYKGVMAPHSTKNSAWHIELYTARRFIALTGNFLPGHEGWVGTDATAALAAFAAEYFPHKGGAYAGEWTDAPAAGWDFLTDDAELVAWAVTHASAAQTFGGKASFKALWTADETLGGFFPPNGVGQPYDPSSADQSLANHLAWLTGNDCERTLRLMEQSALKRDKWNREDYLHGTIAKACGSPKDKWPTKPAPAPEDVPVGTDDPRAIIMLKGGKFDQYAAQAEQLISDTIYVRGASLVRIGRAAELVLDGSGTKRDAAQAVCIAATAGWLRRELMARAQFWKFDKRANAWEPRDCPRELAENIGDQGAWSNFRPLIAITPVPFLRPDMSVVTAPGYDVATGIYYQPTMAVPPILERPTRDDALQALARLREPFNEFPFASDEGVAVFLSHVIGSVLRPSFDTSPIFLYTSPIAATGKTLLADVASIIAHGVVPAHSPYSEGDELKKVLFSSLLAGDSALTLDNVPNGLKVRAPGLCLFATSSTYSDRVLGVSENRKVPNRCTVVMTGNNITPVSDMARRSLVSRLDVNAETARGRKFRIRDLRGHVRAHRAQFIVDVLTIVRAHAFAGHPDAGHPLESFEEWSRLVRDPLLWLGMADAVGSQATETDDEVTPLRGAFEAIAAATQATDYVFTAGQLAGMAAFVAPSPASALRDALFNAGCAEPSNATKVGYWLREQKDRVGAGWKLARKASALNNVASWHLLPVGVMGGCG